MACVLTKSDFTYQSEKQIKEQLKNWNMSRHIKREEWAAVIRKTSLRSQVGKRSIVFVRRFVVTEARVERYVRDLNRSGKAVEVLGAECEFEMTKLDSRFLITSSHTPDTGRYQDLHPSIHWIPEDSRKS